MKQPKIIETKVEKCKRNLHMPLTQDEFRDRSTELAKALSTKAGLERKMASVRSSIKAEIDVADGTISKLHQIVSENAEWRDVQCEKHLDYDRRKVWFVNVETGEKFDERTMRLDEMQIDLPLDDEPPEPMVPYEDDQTRSLVDAALQPEPDDVL